MSEMPPPAPPMDNMPGSDPAAKVKGPAIFLMVVGGLIILGCILGILFNLLGIGLNAANGREGIGGMMSGGIGLVFNILDIIFGIVILLGAMKMAKLRGYGLAMTASILAMLPCSLCCLIGLPAGIWALVVLMKPEVKSAFTA